MLVVGLDPNTRMPESDALGGTETSSSKVSEIFFGHGKGTRVTFLLGDFSRYPGFPD